MFGSFRTPRLLPLVALALAPALGGCVYPAYPEYGGGYYGGGYYGAPVLFGRRCRVRWRLARPRLAAVGWHGHHWRRVASW